MFVHSEELNLQDKVLRLFSLYPVQCKLYELFTVSVAVGTQITSLVMIHGMVVADKCRPAALTSCYMIAPSICKHM